MKNESASSSQEGRNDSASQLSNQRNENSVLFSLDSIDAMGNASIDIKNKTPQQNIHSSNGSSSITNTGGSEGSGLIDLSALSALTGQGSGNSSQGQVPINLTAGVKTLGRKSLTNRSSDVKGIALAVISTALVIVLGFIGYQKFVVPTPPPVNNSTISLGAPKQIQLGNVTQAVTKTNEVKSNVNNAPAENSSVTVNEVKTQEKPVEKVQEKRSSSSRANSKRTRKPSTRSSSRSKPARSSSRPSSRSSSRSSSNSSSKSSSKSSSAPKKSEASALLSNLRGGGKSNSPSLPSPIKNSSKRSGPKKPSRRDIVNALKRVNLGTCLSRDPSLKGKGKIDVKIVAVSSGSIKTAQVQNSPFKSSPVGACLEREVKKQRFPSFTDDSISFTFPFRN